MSPTPPPLPAAPQTTQRLARVRLGLILAVAVLAAGVAGLGYLVSFEAISAFVVRIGALPESLRWCGPLLVDTFITLATLFLVWLALSGVRLSRCWDAYYAWALIAVATVASAYLNAAHVQPAIRADAVRWDARLAAGAVPFAVLASVHLLVLLLLRLLTVSPTEDPAVSDAGLDETDEPAAAAMQDIQSGRDDQLLLVVEVGQVDDLLQVVGFREPANDLIDLLADCRVALERQHVVERAALRDFDQAVWIGLGLVRHVLHEKQSEDVILVL
jgi:hypothetical protein